MSVKVITLEDELKNTDNAHLKRLILISRLHSLAVSPFEEELQQALYKCWIEIATVYLANGDLKAVIGKCEQALKSKFPNNIMAQLYIETTRKLL